MTTVQQPAENLAWYALSPEAAAGQMGVNPDDGLDPHEAKRRLEEYGPNEIPAEPPPSVWVVGRAQLVNPMNIMLLIVVAASFAIVQIATAVVVLGLVTFNVVMGTAQELKARASVEALAKLQVPHARVRRSRQVEQIESTTLVPGDIVLLEAGDVVPADGRIASSATLEVQEAALTGESAPIPKDAGTLPEGEVALGDRTNLVFQNTQVTRGTATIVVTATGSATEMGKIAGMVTATQRSKSPLQRELDGMTKVFGTIAFAAVAIIAIFGLVRGQDTTTLVLLCISTAIAAIPTGLPTFVQAMLSSGARRLAEHKAVVKSLSDVETLGGTTVINSDKTGTLTMNAMTATTMLGGGSNGTTPGRRLFCGRRLRRGRPPGAIVRAWCPRRNQRGRPVSKGSGMTRGDRRRNARRERLRAVLPRDGAVIGIDLAEDKQAIAVIDHDVRVLARKTVRVKAFRLGEALDWAVGQARAKGFSLVTVACEPTGPRWLQVQRLCAERGLLLVCIQPLVSHIAREQQDYTTHKTDEADCVLIARLAVELHCYLPEELDETWAHLRHLGLALGAADHGGDRVGAADPGFPVGGLADGDRDMRPAAGVRDLAGGRAGGDVAVRRGPGQAGRDGGRGLHRAGPRRGAGLGRQEGLGHDLPPDLRRADRDRGRGRLLPPRPAAPLRR